MIAWRVVPIERWPGEQTRVRKQHPFSVAGESGARKTGVDWSGTVSLLERELRELNAKNVLLQMAVTDKDIRQDGWIRGNATPSHPGVILTFDSRFGPLSYPCDTFAKWQANVRAIALALEALRKVDRYGVTRRGEQYTGWKALPPAGGSTSTMTARAAAEVLVAAEALDGEAAALLHDEQAFRWTYRTAAKNTHPDAGGDDLAFQRVQEAKRVLEQHHGGGKVGLR